MLHQTYYSDSYDVPPIPVTATTAPKAPSSLSVETLQTIDETHPWEEFPEEYHPTNESEPRRPASSSSSSAPVSQCCGTKYNYTFRFRRILIMILILLLGILVTLVVVLITHTNQNSTNEDESLYQYVVDIQHGEIDMYLDDSFNGTWYTTTCKTILAIHQTKRCYSDDIVVKLVNVNVHKIATVAIQLIPGEYDDDDKNKGCDFDWNVTAIVDSNKYGSPSSVESCLYHGGEDDDDDDDDDDNSFITMYTHHEVRVKVTGESTR